MRTLALFVFATAIVTAAPVPKVAKKQDDSKALKGRWESVSLDLGSGPRADTSWWLEIKDGKLSTGQGQGNGYVTRTIKLDPAVSPKNSTSTTCPANSSSPSTNSTTIP